MIILTKAIDGPLLIRRVRTNRKLQWGIIAPTFSGGQPLGD